MFLHHLQFNLRIDSFHPVIHTVSQRYRDIDSENYYEANFPTDDNGRTCSYDYPKQPYVYFSNPNDLTSGRYCVSSCPGQGESLQCSEANANACSAFGPSQYPTVGTVNRLGAFCNPVDEKLAENLWSQPQLSVKNSILNSLDLIMLSLLFGFCLGVIYMVLVACCPKIISKLVFVAVFIALLIAGIFVLAKPVRLFTPNIWNILLGVALIIAALVFLIYLACHSRELTASGIFLDNANKFLAADPLVFGYIPLFIILTFGLIVLIVWQYIAFGTVNQTYRTEG